MFLIVGLGNPGGQYERTRHNAGFRVVERLVSRHGLPRPRARFQGESSEGQIDGTRVVLLKPLTYMNLSGRSVGEALRFYKLAPAQLLVIHDEVDLPFGRLRFKQGGGLAGHNGLRSIASVLATQDFARLRVGVDRPSGPQPVADYVLAPFSRAEEEGLPDVLDRACEGVEVVLREGIEVAMNRFNAG